ncbi:MAG: RNA-binding S4 domain-containing protein [Candidatus Izemoplasmatales bacterium]|nr:RNA-binding S4 domain-containing protein [Candidatus Izemoplasmatales bacterium]
MRLDKYLKVSRIFKRRTIAKEIASLKRITINDHLAKPSSIVSVGDIIHITYGNKRLSIRVLDLQNQTAKDDAASLYEIIAEVNHHADNERTMEQ